jgi:hypothetical protein
LTDKRAISDDQTCRRAIGPVRGPSDAASRSDMRRSESFEETSQIAAPTKPPAKRAIPAPVVTSAPSATDAPISTAPPTVK